MKKYSLLIVFTLLICGALLLGAQLFANPGYIKIAYQDSYVETTILTFLSGMLILWLLEKLLIKLWHFLNFRNRTVQKNLKLGLLAFLRKDWQAAIQLLGGLSVADPLRSLPRLLAASAASQLGQTEQVNQYLQNINDKDLSAQLVHIELLLDNHQLDAAHRLILPIYTRRPKDNRYLSVYVRVLLARQAWSELLEVLPRVVKQQLYAADQLQQFIQKVISHAMQQAIDQDKSQQPEQLWQGLPRQFRKLPAVQACYIELLAKHQHHQLAEKWLVKWLKTDNLNDFLMIFRGGKLASTLAIRQHIQHLLKSQPHNVGLLCALAYLALRDQDFSLMINVLEKALGLDNQSIEQLKMPPPLMKGDLKVLADAYVHQGNLQKATRIYQSLL